VDGYIGQFNPEQNNLQIFNAFGAEDMAFLCLGLANEALFFDNTQALEAARSLIRCFIQAQDAYEHPAGHNYSAISLCQAALVIYRLTGETEFLDIARHTVLGPERTSQAASLLEWVKDPPFDAGWHNWWKKTRDSVGVNTSSSENSSVDIAKEATVGDSQDVNAARSEIRKIWHVYRHLDRLVTQMQLHRVDPDERYLRMTRMVRPLLTAPEKAGMSISGGIGCGEGWSENQDSHKHSETCASTYSLWFFEELINLDQDLSQGDLMERVIYNTLFAAQEPDGRKLRYFTPFSGRREYYTTDLFCCPGNFRRGISRLSLNVLYCYNGGIAINLYTSFEADVTLPGNIKVKILQETNYPNEGKVRITFTPSKPAKFPLHLRLPRWCSDPVVLVNGKKMKSGAVIERRWRRGDVVELDMKMEWRWISGTELNEGLFALMHGPVLYCLNPSRNNLDTLMNLRDITINPYSEYITEHDTSIRPDGLSVRVSGWSPGHSPTQDPDLSLTLTEFPDPDGQEIYFRLSDPSVAVEDELIDNDSPDVSR
jgi:DUF1680 family protein